MRRRTALPLKRGRGPAECLKGYPYGVLVPQGPKPNRFCEPTEAFGKMDAPVRRWLLPQGEDPKRTAQFREAVIQHGICVTVRRFKNFESWTQERLARTDLRSGALTHWNAVLNGRVVMSFEDYAYLVRVLPDGLPSAGYLAALLQVAEGESVPEDWAEVDR